MAKRRTRETKYPNTDVFQYFNQNPHKRITTDCVIRAISLAEGIPYNQCVMEMAQMQCDTGYDDACKELIDRYLKSKGWTKCKQPRKEDRTKYTGAEFCRKIQHPIYCEELDLPGWPDFNWHHMIANIGGHHIVAIMDGKIHDIWDCSRKCIGNVWVKAL